MDNALPVTATDDMSCAPPGPDRIAASRDGSRCFAGEKKKHYLCANNQFNRDIMTTIAYITLLIAALFDLSVVLGRDLTAHQENEFSNRRYNAWLRKSGELSSLRRILVLAVLIGTCTTMAQMSWIVIMILAAVLLAQGIYLLSNNHWKLFGWNSRMARMFFTAIILTLAAVGITGYLGSFTGNEDATRSAAIVAVIILAITPLLTMLTAWLLTPIEKLLGR